MPFSGGADRIERARGLMEISTHVGSTASRERRKTYEFMNAHGSLRWDSAIALCMRSADMVWRKIRAVPHGVRLPSMRWAQRSSSAGIGSARAARAAISATMPALSTTVRNAIANATIPVPLDCE